MPVGLSTGLTRTRRAGRASHAGSTLSLIALAAGHGRPVTARDIARRSYDLTREVDRAIRSMSSVHRRKCETSSRHHHRDFFHF